MRRLVRHMVITLYVGLLGFCVVTVYICSIQSDPDAPLHPCHGDLAESCRYENERSSFEGAHEQAKTLKNSAHNPNLNVSRTKGNSSSLLKILPENEEIKRKGPSNQQNVKQPEVDSFRIFEQIMSNRPTHEVHSSSDRGNSKPQRKHFQQDLSMYARKFPNLYQPSLNARLDCTKVWLGEEKEISRAQNELNEIKAPRRPPRYYSEITEDCAKYRDHMGYVQEVSTEEQSFPLAFSLLLYKDVEQVERLLRAVYRPNNVYCIHVDLKATSQVLASIRALIKCLPNVIEAPRRVSVQWGKFSVLEPEIICMAALWRMLTKWRYFINLTGQEFPLKTNKELVKILQVYSGANDILGEIPKQRNKWRWAKAGPLPHNFSLGKGPVHVAASRGFVDFLLHSAYARDLMAWAKNTSIPDETFFATLNNQHQVGVPGSYIGNMTSRRRIAINRWKVWDSSSTPCGGKFVRHICHFGLSDVPRLVKSRHLVANKFTYDYQPLGYDCLEQWHFEKVRKEQKSGTANVDTRYYADLEIVKYALRTGNDTTGP